MLHWSPLEFGKFVCTGQWLLTCTALLHCTAGRVEGRVEGGLVERRISGLGGGRKGLGVGVSMRPPRRIKVSKAARRSHWAGRSGDGGGSGSGSKSGARVSMRGSVPGARDDE